MPQPGFVEAVNAVDWSNLPSPYGSGEVVRGVVLRLGSRDEAEVRLAWEQIDRTVLQHQGTVYPATAAAAPFLCQIALDEATLWRPCLIVDLAFMSTGYDEPYAPAGTARTVRDAIRFYASDLLEQWGSADADLDMALVVLSAAFPIEGAAITGPLADWFTRSEPPLRAALGLALGLHGLDSEAVDRIISEKVGQSMRWVARSGPLIMSAPEQSGSPGPDAEPYISSRILDAIKLARHLRSGADELTCDLSPISSFLHKLMESLDRIIDYPAEAGPSSTDEVSPFRQMPRRSHHQ